MNKIITEMMLITPETAKRILDKNTNNRPLNKETVNFYAKQMSDGKWTLSGQTISFSDKNLLLDGQHRLAAIITSNLPIWFNVARNVPHDSFINYDSLRARKVSDVFAIEKIQNYVNVSSVIASYFNLRDGVDYLTPFLGSGTTRNKGRTKIEKKTFLDYYKTNPELIQECSQQSKNNYNHVKFYSPAAIGALMLYLIIDRNHNKEKVFSFFNQLYTNTGITNESIYLLRERLIQSSLGSYTLTKEVQYVYLKKCWNAYINNKVVMAYKYVGSEQISFI